MSSITVREELDLESIFPGGVRGERFKASLQAVRSALADCQTGLQDTPAADLESLAALATRIHQTGRELGEASSFSNLILVGDTGNDEARLVSGQVEQLFGSFDVLLTQLDRLLAQLPPAQFDRLLNHLSSGGLADALRERRSRSSGLVPAQEAAIKGLAPDGLAGWIEVAQIINARLTIPWEENGESRNLPLATAQTMLRENPDPTIRKRIADKLGEAYAQEAPLLTAVLNHRAGYRVTSYQLRGWDSVLHEALRFNRIEEKSLDAMNAVLMAHQAPLQAYFRRKATLLGTGDLPMYELGRPIGELPPLTWAETASRISTYFEGFSTEMGAFAREMFTAGHFDLMERPGRQLGISVAYWFPSSRTSRLFMNHKHLPTIVAHEMGHAYSDRFLWDSGLLSGMQDAPMTLLEVPSTFSQLLVGKRLARESASREERIARLDELCMSAGVELSSRRGLFLFEKKIYEARRQGPLNAEQVCTIYQNAFAEATGGCVRPDHPYRWVGHSLMNGHMPFYNFPYTVALLLSAGLYARWTSEGPAFAERYMALMGEFGSLTVEEIAAKHLGADLSRPEFWESAVAVLMEDVHEFLKLTEETV